MFDKIQQEVLNQRIGVGKAPFVPHIKAPELKNKPKQAIQATSVKTWSKNYEVREEMLKDIPKSESFKSSLSAKKETKSSSFSQDKSSYKDKTGKSKYAIIAEKRNKHKSDSK